MTYLPTHGPVLAQIDNWEAAQKKFNADWTAMARSETRIPVQLVIDLISILRNTVIEPFQRQLDALISDNYLARDALRQIRDASLVLKTIWPKRLKPLLEEAVAAKKRGVKVMDVRVPNAPGKTLRSQINLTFTWCAEDMKTAREIVGSQHWFARLPWVSTAIFAFADASNKALAVARDAWEVVEDVTEATIAGAQKAVEVTKLALYATIIGGAAYLVWKRTPRAR